MEKKPNLKIGEQEFKRVGEMKSEDTELKHAPKSFDLYQDQDGALMGKLPKNHPSEELNREAINKAIEQKIENLDIDLTKLTPCKIINLLRPDKDVKIYGKFIKRWEDGRPDPWFKRPKYNYDTADVAEILKVRQDPHYNIAFGPAYEIVKDGVGDSKNATVIKLDGRSNEWKKEWRIEENKVFVPGRGNSVTTDGFHHFESDLEFSFFEIPEGYKELMEKKEGKAA